MYSGEHEIQMIAVHYDPESSMVSSTRTSRTATPTIGQEDELGMKIGQLQQLVLSMHSSLTQLMRDLEDIQNTDVALKQKIDQMQLDWTIKFEELKNVTEAGKQSNENEQNEQINRLSERLSLLEQRFEQQKPPKDVATNTEHSEDAQSSDNDSSSHIHETVTNSSKESPTPPPELDDNYTPVKPVRRRKHQQQQRAKRQDATDDSGHETPASGTTKKSYSKRKQRSSNSTNSVRRNLSAPSGAAAIINRTNNQSPQHKQKENIESDDNEIADQIETNKTLVELENVEEQQLNADGNDSVQLDPDPVTMQPAPIGDVSQTAGQTRSPKPITHTASEPIETANANFVLIGSRQQHGPSGSVIRRSKRVRTSNRDRMGLAARANAWRQQVHAFFARRSDEQRFSNPSAARLLPVESTNGTNSNIVLYRPMKHQRAQKFATIPNQRTTTINPLYNGD